MVFFYVTCSVHNVLSLLFSFFHYPMVLLCSYGLTVLYQHPHRIFALLPTLTPFGLQCPQLRPKAWSIAGRHQDSSCAWHMFTKNSSLCFISLHLTLHFTPIPTHPFLSPLAPTTPFGTGDRPRGPVLNPSLTLHAASSSSSLNPYWNPIVSDNQRHLSQEPAAQTEEDAWKKGPNWVKDSEKKPRDSCWGRLFKSYSSNKFDSIVQHATKYENHIALMITH